jgi:DNA-binding response OmpR family regulator
MRDRPRVLVVDDNQLAHQSTLFALRFAGYPVIAVSTPQQALDAVELFKPRVVLLEWAFRDPEHRRIPLSRRLHEAARALHQPMSIVVVSHLEPSRELEDVEYVALYLVKPVSFDVVEAAIEHAQTGPMCSAVLPPLRDSRA